jgi:hypothetical protein
LRRAIEDPEWAKWAEKKTRENLKNMPEMRPLQERLLDVGGDWVALQLEPDVDKILKRGQLFEVKLYFRRWKICVATPTALTYGTVNRRNTRS